MLNIHIQTDLTPYLQTDLTPYFLCHTISHLTDNGGRLLMSYLA